MTYALNPVEARILGVLIEKQLSTPEYYPLTLNALINACNQKSNRDPVMSLDEAAVVEALNSLRQKNLVWQIMTHGSRTAKYEHNMKDVADFSEGQLAVLCELMLRGPQTIGELRTRTARLTEFYGLSDVEYTVKKLMADESGPFAVQLPRRPGHKESRYAHLFCEVDASEDTYESPITATPTRQSDADNRRIDVLEKKVEELQAALSDLRDQFLIFKRELE
jgi:uncharacterized protein YceH (UPF0502 family)